MGKREDVTKYILKSVKISPTTVKILTNLLNGFTTEEFHDFMERLRDKKINLSFIVPHEESIGEEAIFGWASDVGIKPFQKLTYFDGKNEYTTTVPTLIIDAIGKRAAQTQDKKVSIPTGNKINVLTGQVTSESLSAKITLPETLIHIGFGAKSSLHELINVRGGDLGLGNAMDKALFTKGSVNISEIEAYSTKNVTSKTLKAYLLASHLGSTL